MEKHSKEINPNSRITLIILAISLVAGLIIFRLVYMQIIHAHKYKDAADKQYTTPQNNIYERGSIYFTKKNGELITAASQVTGYKLAITPSEIVDKEDT